MSTFQMPYINPRNDLPQLLFASFFPHSERQINRTFMNYLNVLKSKIDYNSLAWNKYKRYANPYEFIDTALPTTNEPVSSLTPLSRSYYKMVEICHTFHLLNQPTQIKTFHLAEGPGGFIQAVCDLRKNPHDTYYGMTLVDPSNQNVPGWHNSQRFLEAHPNVELETGLTQNGDIMSRENLTHCFQKYSGTMDLVTADAGIDFSFDFALQENTCANLILAQIAFACAILKSEGAFVLKTFDISIPISVDMLYFLSLAFDSVEVFKPHTSRYANSERYIIAKGFRVAADRKIFDFFHRSMNHEITRIFNVPVPYLYINKLEECNAIIGQQQVEYILMTLSLLENPKPQRLESIRRRNTALCVKWCERHGIPVHSLESNNIFTQQCATK